jgi:hypothetical protein
MDRLFMFTHFNECKCHSGHVNYGTATPLQLQVPYIDYILLPIYKKHQRSGRLMFGIWRNRRSNAVWISYEISQLQVPKVYL